VVPNEKGAALLVKVAGPDPKENEEFEGAGLKHQKACYSQTRV
jgi:hypothetical protein